LVGNAKDIVAGFGTYSHELAKLVTNVSNLYDVTSALPAYQPDPSKIRVLDVSDLHLNPAAWDVIRSITAQFGIGVIVDSGDITDHGTSAERRFVAPIADLKVPYVYVRGNHDSTAIQQAVAAEPNAVVLDGGMVREVGGLRFIGEGDPRFTPDRSTEPAGEDMVAQAGQVTAGAATAATPRPDVAVVHDPVMGQQLDGIVPLVLAGHLHKRGNQVLKAGTRLFVQGSTGGAGLRALEGATPTPIECSVLYFDAVTKHLQAWDDITVGGLGLTSAQIDRTLAPEEAAHLHATAGGGPPPAESEPAAPTAAAVEGAPRRG
jgi:predicted MPP superfamily phosphohydrolase